MSSRKSRNHRAFAALDQGNWLKAVDLLKDGLDRYPRCLEIALNLTRVYMERGYYPMAEELVDQAFSWSELDDPENTCPVTEAQKDLYLLKANIRLAQGDPEGALTLYTLLLSERAHDPDLLFHAGLAYEKLAQHELAVSYLDRAIAVDPEYLPPMEIKGQILLCMGQFKEALELYGEMALCHPNNVNAYVMLGRIYHHLKRPVAAVTAWERAVALAPNADEPLRMLGLFALKSGEFRRARDLLTRAVEANPHNVHAHLDLADFLYNQGETRAALAHWDEAEALFPGHPRLERCREQRDTVAGQIHDWFPFPLPKSGQEPAAN